MEKMKNKKQVLLAASVAGLLAMTGALVLPATADAEEVPCFGVNACKGTGACKGQANECAGKNACKGQGVIQVESKEACLGMQGESLTPPSAAKA